jgi:hypothetical protein
MAHKDAIKIIRDTISIKFSRTEKFIVKFMKIIKSLIYSSALCYLTARKYN